MVFIIKITHALEDILLYKFVMYQTSRCWRETYLSNEALKHIYVSRYVYILCWFICINYHYIFKVSRSFRSGIIVFIDFLQLTVFC